MTTTGVFSLKGLDEYLNKIAQAGQDVDASAERAVTAGGDLALAGMQDRAPVLTGELKAALECAAPAHDGNFVSVRVGMPAAAIDADLARYANVQEYGSAHTPAHPYIRPTFQADKAKVFAAMRESLEQDGIV